MKISIITVSFNAEKTIQSTLESVASQDHPNIEYIILDGASTDTTPDIVHKFIDSHPNLAIKFYSAPDKGMYDALNKGLAMFNGDAIGALNADDTYHDTAAVSRIAATLAHSDIAHGDLDFVLDHENKTITRRWRVADYPRGGFRSGWMPAHPTFYVRRRVVDAVGQFDLRLKTASDYDYMLRAIELHDFTVSKTPGILVDMKIGGKSTRGLTSYIAHNIEALQSRQRWLNANYIDFALFSKPASKLKQLAVRRSQ